MIYRCRRQVKLFGIVYLALNTVAGSSAKPQSEYSLSYHFHSKQEEHYNLDIRTSAWTPLPNHGRDVIFSSAESVVIRERVAKLLQNSAAVLAIKTLSGNEVLNGSTITPNTKAHSVLISITSHGRILSASNAADGMADEGLTVPVLQSGMFTLGTMTLPSFPIHVGQHWTQNIDINSSGKAQQLKMRATFLRVEPVGLYTAASIKAVLSGTLSIPASGLEGKTAGNKNLPCHVWMVFNTDVAIKQGIVLRSAILADIRLVATESDGSKKPVMISMQIGSDLID